MATDYLRLIVAIKRSRRPLTPNIGNLHWGNASGGKGREKGGGGEGREGEGV